MTLAIINNARKRGRTRYAKAVQFFYAHAGYSYNPKTETRLAGKRRCARELARAEQYASEQGWEFEWRDDWGIGSHVREFGEESYPEEPDKCESCVLWNADRTKVLASLGCVDDASAEYRRVVQAELALEAMASAGD